MTEELGIEPQRRGQHDSLRGLVRQHLPTYRSQLRAFIDFLDKSGNPFNDPESIREAVAEYRKRRLKQGKAPGTVSVDVTAIRKLIRIMVERSPQIPLQEVRLIQALLSEKPFKVSGKRGSAAKVSEDKILAPEEVMLLADAASERLRLMVLFLYATAARVSEMLSIRLKDLRPFNGYVLIRILGKGGVEADLPPVERGLVDEIIRVYEPETYLFETRGKRGRGSYRREYVFQQIAKTARRLWPDRRVGCHTLRHSAATRFYQQTGSIKKTQHLLRHSRASITSDMYIHESYSAEEALALYREIKDKPGEQKSGGTQI